MVKYTNMRAAPSNQNALGVLKKHAVIVAGHQTSVTLENIFWQSLQTIARFEGKSLNKLVTEIDRNRVGGLSSAIRVFVLLHFKDLAAS